MSVKRKNKDSLLDIDTDIEPSFQFSNPISPTNANLNLGTTLVPPRKPSLSKVTSEIPEDPFLATPFSNPYFDRNLSKLTKKENTESSTTVSAQGSTSDASESSTVEKKKKKKHKKHHRKNKEETNGSGETNIDEDSSSNSQISIESSPIAIKKQKSPKKSKSDKKDQDKIPPSSQPSRTPSIVNATSILSAGSEDRFENINIAESLSTPATPIIFDNPRQHQYHRPSITPRQQQKQRTTTIPDIDINKYFEVTSELIITAMLPKQVDGTSLRQLNVAVQQHSTNASQSFKKTNSSAENLEAKFTQMGHKVHEASLKVGSSLEKASQTHRTIQKLQSQLVHCDDNVPSMKVIITHGIGRFFMFLTWLFAGIWFILNYPMMFYKRKKSNQTGESENQTKTDDQRIIQNSYQMMRSISNDDDDDDSDIDFSDTAIENFMLIGQSDEQPTPLE